MSKETGNNNKDTKMKKKTLLAIFIAFTGINLQGFAQGTTIPNYSKVLELTNKVNKRKAPNASSPKLMVQVNSNSSVVGFTWGNAGGNYQYFPAFSEPDILWVIDETPDWYHGYYGEPNEMREVYVAKKSAKVKRPLVNKDYVSQCDFDVVYTERTGGKYNGYIIIASNECKWMEREENGKFLFIGKKINGICVGKCFSTESQHEGWAELPSQINTNNLTDGQISLLINIAPKGSVVLLPAKYTCYYPGETYDWYSFKDIYFRDSIFPNKE